MCDYLSLVSPKLCLSERRWTFSPREPMKFGSTDFYSHIRPSYFLISFLRDSTSPQPSPSLGEGGETKSLLKKKGRSMYFWVRDTQTCLFYCSFVALYNDKEDYLFSRCPFDPGLGLSRSIVDNELMWFRASLLCSSS